MSMRREVLGKKNRALSLKGKIEDRKAQMKVIGLQPTTTREGGPDL